MSKWWGEKCLVYFYSQTLIGLKSKKPAIVHTAILFKSIWFLWFFSLNVIQLIRFQKSVGTLQPIYLQSSYAVIFRRFYPIPLLFPDEKRFDLLAFSAVSHLDALGVQVR